MPTNLTTSSASSTMHTYLGVATGTGSTYNKLIDIKDFPAMGGAPEQIETTTLSQEVATFVNGVQSMSALEFLANYTKDDYDRVKAFQDGKVRKYCLVFGKTGTSTTATYGDLGSFTWEGSLSAWLEGGSVNGVREMRISISATTEVNSESITFNNTDATASLL